MPLAFTIAVITLTTSYVPYLGATLATPATAAALLVHRRLASTGPESSPAAEDDAPEPAAG